MGYPKSNGDVFSADEANSGVYNIIELYEGTGLDSTGSSSDNTITLTASQINKYDFIDIQINGKFLVYDNGSTTAEISLKIENVIPAPDETILATYKVVDSIIENDRNTIETFNLVYELTTDDKTNGIGLKFTITGVGSYSFTNRQIIIRGSLKY